MMNEKEKLMTEEMLKSGKILSEDKYYDGTKDTWYCFREVEFEGCVFYITTWNEEIVYCRFDRLA